MNDEVKYPVIKLEDVPEEELKELEDKWKRMEANTKAYVEAHINSGKPLVKLECITEEWGDLTGEPAKEVANRFSDPSKKLVEYVIDWSNLTDDSSDLDEEVKELEGCNYLRELDYEDEKGSTHIN